MYLNSNYYTSILFVNRLPTKVVWDLIKASSFRLPDKKIIVDDLKKTLHDSGWKVEVSEPQFIDDDHWEYEALITIV